MKRAIMLLVAMAMALGLLAGTALAKGKSEWHGVPPHGHIMLLGVTVEETEEGVFVHYDRCVELAKGKALPTPAHHDSLHTGTPGGSPFVQGALYDAGIWVVPLAPLTPITGCDGLPNPIPFG
jgi:hypothetical protein